jgi:hypothetical protein
MIIILRWLLVTLIASVALEQSTLAYAQATDQVKTVATSIPGVKAIAPLPTEYLIDHASDTEIAEYGLPPKPDRASDPEGYANWAKIAGIKRIIPKLKENKDIRNPPPKILKETRISPTSVAVTSDTWSGVAISDPSAPFLGAKAGILGNFIVISPDPRCPADLPINRYDSSQWVGIDGWEGNDVLQTGVHTVLICPSSASIYPWFEWFSSGSLSPEVQIQNLPTLPGDAIQTWVSATGHITIFNLTRGVGVSVGVPPPAGTHLIGNTIEWIYERPGINATQSNPAGTPSHLVPYVFTAITGAVATVNGPANRYWPGGPNASGTIYVIDMNDSDYNRVNPLVSHAENYSGNKADTIRLSPDSFFPPYGP